MSETRLVGLSILDLLMPTMIETKAACPDTPTAHNSKPVDSQAQRAESKAGLEAAERS